MSKLKQILAANNISAAEFAEVLKVDAPRVYALYKETNPRLKTAKSVVDALADLGVTSYRNNEINVEYLFK